MKLLSQNGRLHHMERYRRGQALKKATWALALKAKIPPLERVSILVEYQPRDNRDTDPDNVPPASGKPCIDALVAARILADDSKRYVTSVTGVIGPVFPRGRIVVHVTEVAAAAESDGAT
jgi:Holliday junction resolvase RusA-like endonuclease